MKEFKIIKRRDDHRWALAYKDGGFPLNDQVIINKFRNAFKLLIS